MVINRIMADERVLRRFRYPTFLRGIVDSALFKVAELIQTALSQVDLGYDNFRRDKGQGTPLIRALWANGPIVNPGEGDWAGGTAKRDRNNSFQALLPLRTKALDQVAKATCTPVDALTLDKFALRKVPSPAGLGPVKTAPPTMGDLGRWPKAQRAFHAGKSTLGPAAASAGFNVVKALPMGAESVVKSSSSFGSHAVSALNQVHPGFKAVKALLPTMGDLGRWPKFQRAFHAGKSASGLVAASAGFNAVKGLPMGAESVAKARSRFGSRLMAEPNRAHFGLNAVKALPTGRESMGKPWSPFEKTLAAKISSASSGLKQKRSIPAGIESMGKPWSPFEKTLAAKMSGARSSFKQEKLPFSPLRPWDTPAATGSFMPLPLGKRSTAGIEGVAKGITTSRISAITKGSQNQTHITLKLEKLQDKTEIHTTSVRESHGQMEKSIKEILLRALNSARQAAAV